MGSTYCALDFTDVNEHHINWNGSCGCLLHEDCLYHLRDNVSIQDYHHCSNSIRMLSDLVPDMAQNLEVKRFPHMSAKPGQDGNIHAFQGGIMQQTRMMLSQDLSPSSEEDSPVSSSDETTAREFDAVEALTLLHIPQETIYPPSPLHYGDAADLSKWHEPTIP